MSTPASAVNERKPFLPALTTESTVRAARLSNRSAGVGDGDRAAAGRDRSEDLVVLLDVNERRAGRADGRAADGARRRAGEGDGAEVGEGNEGAALLEVLDDPLRVVLAERGLAGEGVRDGLPGRLVGDRRRAARLGSRGDRDGHSVAGGEADTGEVVGVVRVPLVPR